jgi:hypothetical protein
LIQVLGEAIAKSGMPVECGENEMLVTVRLRTGRKQVVKMREMRGRSGTHTVLRLQSRVCIAQGAPMVRLIREALKVNADANWGAYALDTSVNPPLVDVVYSYVRTPECEWMPGDLFNALQRVAAFADAAEQYITGGDVF